MTILERISGSNGSCLVTGTNAKVYEFEAFVVNEDCIVGELLLNGHDVAGDVYAIKGHTLSAGMIIFAPTGKTFTSITLESGSVILY
jgi:hypothetical protein